MKAPSPFAPFEILAGDRRRGLVLLADHAMRLMPEEYGALGLPPREFERHIAYDIGVEALTRALSRHLAAPALLARFSRLLIDPNRGEDDPTLIRQLYDGTIIPGNYPMSAEERERRLERFYRPYHDAAGALIASVARAAGRAPFIISIHSFTPRMQGQDRPWHVGILWDSDPRAPQPLIDMLRRQDDLVVGDNEPYDGALWGDTMYRHAIVNGYPHVLIEMRQDLVAEDAAAEAWAARLASMLEAVDAGPDMRAVKHYGSRTGHVLKEQDDAGSER